MRSTQNLSEIENAIRIYQGVFPNEDPPPDLENRTDDDADRERQLVDGEPVIRVLNYQSYLRYNSGTDRLFDEYGILKRDFDTQEDMNCDADVEDRAPNFSGGCNLLDYINEYEQQHWEQN